MKALILFFLLVSLAGCSTVPYQGLSISMPSGDRLEASIDMPEGPGPFPTVILTHGSDYRFTKSTHTSTGELRFLVTGFIKRGWAVITVIRRGYGYSTGTAELFQYEGGNTCPDYIGRGQWVTEDLLAAIAFAKIQPFVDPHRIVVAGKSAGGFAAIALSAHAPDGVVGAISFAGGWKSLGGSAWMDSCYPEATMAFKKFGETSRIPTIWIYADNDDYFPPRVAQNFVDAFQSTGGKALLVSVPSYNIDSGHCLINKEGSGVPWADALELWLSKLPVTVP